jgi:Ca2+-binding RTX toxin-like protein
MKKRIALVVGSAGLLVFLVAGVAFAMTITGTNRPDNITATNRADNIAASANRDVVNGSGGPDRIFGDGGNDTNDFVSGGNGTDDVCVVDLIDGESDEYSDTCEEVYQTESMPHGTLRKDRSSVEKRVGR